MNIFRHELKSYRRSTFVWAASLSTLVFIFMMLFPAFTNDVATSKKLLQSLPPALRSVLGIQLANFFTIFGFYSYLFTYAVLSGGVQAMNLGVSIISKEDSGKTAEFLLTKPVTRPAVMTAKLLAALVSLAVTNIVFIIVAAIAAEAVSTKPFSMKIFIMISLILFFVQLIFLALGVLVSMVLPRVRSVIAVSLPVVFGFFIISALGSVLGSKTVRYITPFKFYDPFYIVKHGSYEGRFVLLEIIFIIVAVAASYLIYAKRDIRSVS